MCWKVDPVSCQATYKENDIYISIWRNEYGRFEVTSELAHQTELWSCTPQTLQQAICETKRGLKRLANDLCAAANAKTKIIKDSNYLPW